MLKHSLANEINPKGTKRERFSEAHCFYQDGNVYLVVKLYTKLLSVINIYKNMDRL